MVNCDKLFVKVRIPNFNASNFRTFMQKCFSSFAHFPPLETLLQYAHPPTQTFVEASVWKIIWSSCYWIFLPLQSFKFSIHQSFGCLKGTPTVNLYASRMPLCHQLPQYMTWKPEPNIFATDAMQQDWNKLFRFAFSSFSLIGRVLNKILQKM